MPEPSMVTLYCEPCPHCVFHAWQRIADGRLRWEAEWECERCEFGAPAVCNLDHGWGRAPDDVRAAVVAAEGTVLLRVDGTGGAAPKVFRDALGMTIPEVLAAVREGYKATPVEAEYLTHLFGEAGFAVRVTASGPGGPG